MSLSTGESTLTTRRFALTSAALLLSGTCAALAVDFAPAAPARGAYNPFTMQRALEAPNAPENAGIRRRLEVLNRLASRRVTPPGHAHARSPFKPGRPPTTPPPWTPPGGGIGTNPGGNTTGPGNANGPN